MGELSFSLTNNNDTKYGLQRSKELTPATQQDKDFDFIFFSTYKQIIPHAWVSILIMIRPGPGRSCRLFYLFVGLPTLMIPGSSIQFSLATFILLSSLWQKRQTILRLYFMFFFKKTNSFIVVYLKTNMLTHQ